MASKKLPKITIVTPSYNQGEFIEETILSVLNQKYPNLEYIIIDGGSTDQSVEIIRKYEQHLTYWVSEKDRGQAHAINKGFIHATGDILAWLNSDDFYYADTFKCISQAYEKYPGAGLYIGKGYIVDKQCNIVRPFSRSIGFDASTLINGQTYLNQPSVFISRRAIDKVGPLDESLNNEFDVEYWIRIGKEFEAVVMDEFLSAFRWYDEIKTVSSGLNRWIEMYKVRERYTNRGLTPGLLVEFFHIARNEPLLNEFGADIKNLIEKTYELTFSRNQTLLNLTDNVPAGRGIYFVPDKTASFSVNEENKSAPSIIRHTGSKPRVDIVQQATGTHSWGVYGGWANAAHKLGILNRIFSPKGQWGDLDISDDDGLCSYLLNPQADIMLMPGFDWHSQMLHTSEKWQDLWINSKIIKILFSQEAIEKSCVMFENSLMKDAALSAAHCVDGIIYIDLNDTDFWKQTKKPALWQLLGVDDNIFYIQKRFGERIARPFFRGQITPHFTSKTYSERREFMQFLIDNKAVELLDYIKGQKPDKVVEDFNNYQIAVNLPTLSAYHPSRVTEAMACGCSLITNRTGITPLDNLFTHGEHLLYYSSKEELLEAVRLLSSDKSYSEKLAQKGYEYTLEHFTLDKLLLEIIHWTNKFDSVEINQKERIENFIQIESSKQDKKAMRSIAQEKPKKILIDGVIFYLHKDRPLGISRVWKSLLTELSKTQLADRILLLDRDSTSPFIPGIKWRTVKGYDHMHFEDDSLYLEEICREENAEIFISTYYTYPENSHCMIMLHDMIPELTGMDMSLPEWRAKAKSIEKAHAYSSVSASTMNDFRKLYPHYSHKKIYLTQPAASEEFRQNSSEEINSLRKKYNIEKPYFMLVGHRAIYKNALLFFRAFSLLENKSDYEILCTGGAKELEKVFLPYVKGIRYQVRFLSDRDLSIAYSGALSLVYASQYEGFGLPILEAMRSVCPVITCRNSSIPEVAENAALYVDVHDVAGMKEALIKIQEPHIRESYVTRGIENVKRFSWGNTCEQFVTALNDIINNLKDIPLNSTDLLNTKNRLFYILAKRDDCDELLSAMKELKEVCPDKENFNTLKLLKYEDVISNMGPEIFNLFQHNLKDSDEGEGFLYFCYGLALEQRGSSQEALNAYLKAKKQGDLGNVHQWRVTYSAFEIAYQLENLQLAKELMEEFLETNPNFENGKKRLQEIEEELKQKTAKEARPEIKEESIQAKTPERVQQVTQPEIKVSAIVSAYNSEKFIRGCLEDLVNQTLYQKGGLEIVVIDSASQENEQAVVNEFMQKYKNILYLRTAERETVYAAWNRGIKASSGKYITNANTDDRHRKDALEVMSTILGNNPDIGLVYANVIVTDTENETFEKHTRVLAYDWCDYNREKLSIGCFVGPQPLWRRSLHDKYGYFDDSFLVSGDWEFWLRIAEGINFLHIRDFLGLYFRTSNSLEHKNVGKKKEENKIIYKTYIPKYFPLYEEHFTKIIEADPAKTINADIYGQILTALGKYDKASKLYTTYLQKDPNDKEFSALMEEEKNLKAKNIQAQRLPDSQHYEKSQDLAQKSEIKVSAIVSAYNSEKFIRGCLEDLVNQTLYQKGGLEIVVIDSASQENEQAVVNEFMQKYKNIQYLRTAERETVYAAWNRGIKASSGKYITNANTDDRHRKDALEVMGNELDNDPNIALVYGDQIITETENETHDKCTPVGFFNWPDYDRIQLFHCPCIGSQPMWRKNLHKEFGYFDGSLKIAGDYDWWLRISEKFSLKHIPELLGLYFLSSTGLESSYKEQSYLEAGKVRKKYGEKAQITCDFDKHIMSFRADEYPLKTNKISDNRHKKEPMVSVIVPTFNRPEMLRETLNSILKQTYNDYEIIVINDAGVDVKNVISERNKGGNINYFQHSVNKGLAASRNTGIEAARGKYIAYLDDDDIFYPEHLATLVDFLESSDFKVAYTDAYRAYQTEENGKYLVKKRELSPSHDFDYNRILISNYIPVLCFLHEKSCLDEVGLFDEALTSHEDWDLWIRMSRKFQFGHIRKITAEYRFRTDGSTMFSGRRADMLRTMEVIHAKHPLAGDNPSIVQARSSTLGTLRHEVFNTHSDTVSIIIPTFDNLKLTRQCLDAIRQTADNVAYEIIVVDNGSSDDTADYLLQEQAAGRIRAIINKENLGFSKANNQGAKIAKGKYLLFLNNDTIPQSYWLEEMVQLAESDKNIGVVGSKLLYPDNTIQHAGIVFYKTRKPYHIYKGLPADVPCANKQRDYQIVTAACMFLRKELYFEVGGFDERYKNGCEDIDLCLKVREKNKRVVYNPSSVVIHLEAQSEGRQDKMDANRQLFEELWIHKITPDDNYYLKEDGMECMIDSEGSFYFVPSEKIKQFKKSIIIVTFNSAPTIRACLDSVLKYTQGAEVIVVDNASSDETKNILREYENSKLITTIINNENKGFSYACNQGISASSGEYIILLNPDTLVTPNWSIRLLAHFRPGVGAVGPLTNYANTMQLSKYYAREANWENLGTNERAQKLYKWNKGKARETKLLIGFCLALAREILNKIGLLDENLFLGNDDLEISWRLRQNGYKLIIATDTFVYHEGQVSFKTEKKEKTDRLIEESTNHLFRKLEDYYGSGNVPTPMELWGIEWFSPKGATFRSHKPTLGGKIIPGLISIIILAHNEWIQTELCLESIEKYTLEPYEIIVVDNGSVDETRTRLRSLIKTKPNLKVVSNNSNRGFAAGNNQGVAISQGEYILLLNNDTIVTEEWLRRMLAVFKQYPETAIVGPMSNYVDGPQLVTHIDYKKIEEIDFFAARWRKEHDGQSFPMPRIVGFCLLTKREVINRIGGLDEQFGSGNYEDDDFCIRAALAGYVARVAQDVFIHHTGSQTFKSANIDFHESLKNNWEIFKIKWKIPLNVPYGIGYPLPSSLPLGESLYIPLPHLPSTHKADIQKQWWEEIRQKEQAKVQVEGKKKERVKGLASLIILISKDQEKTKKCIRSIQNHTKESYEIIFVPAEASYTPAKWLRKLVRENSNYKLALLNAKNEFVKSSNQGIKDSTGEYIVLLDDAVIVTENWLSGLIECINSDPETGIVGPMTVNVDGPQKIYNADYSSPDYPDVFAGSFREKNRYRRIQVKTLDSFCICFKYELAEKIGLFDERFEIHTYAGGDYCLRAALEGFRNMIVGDVFIHYNGHKPIIFDSIGNSSPAIRDQKNYSEKWGNLDESKPESKKVLSTNALFIADELSQKGQKEKAIVTLLEGIKANSDDKRLHYAIAEILIEDKKFKEALDILENMPSPMKKEAEYLELLGYCKEGIGMNDEANRYADEILQLKNDSPKAWNLKGAIAFKKGLYGDAEKFFLKALEAERGFGEACSNLGALRWIKGNREEALQLFEKAFILSPTLGDVVTNYYTAVVSLSRLSEAEKVLKEAIALHTLNRKLQFILIDNLLQQKKFNEAMEELGNALAIFGVDDDTLSIALNLRSRIGAMEVDKNSQNSISLCMIVKNEENNIIRSLQSAKPIVNEIIIVDTGSTDRTKNIALAFGAKVYDFPWTHDFSAARNFGLSEAGCSWILVLDADEVISSSDYDSLKELIKNSPAKKPAFSIVTRNYVGPVSVNWNPNVGKYKEEKGSGWFPSEKVRLFPNDSRIRFEKPVHEVVEDSLRRIGMEIKKCVIPIHHYGKLDKEKIRAKGEEYYQLGKKKLEEQGQYTPNALYELAIQASELEKYDEALEFWKRLLYVQPNLAKAYHGMGTSCFQLGRYEEALDAFKKALQLEPDSKDPSVMYATCELLLGNAEEAISYLEGLLKKEPMYALALMAITASHFCTGSKEKGLEYVKKVKDTQFSLAHYLKDIAKLLISAQHIDYATSLLETAIETNNAINETHQLLARCYELQKDSRIQGAEGSSNGLKKKDYQHNPPIP